MVYQAELRNARGQPVQVKEYLVTVAITTTEDIRIYTVDAVDTSGNLSLILKFPREAYINCTIIYNAPPIDSVNFALSREAGDLANVKLVLSACTDDGYIFSWDASKFRETSEDAFRAKYRIEK